MMCVEEEYNKIIDYKGELKKMGKGKRGRGRQGEKTQEQLNMGTAKGAVPPISGSKKGRKLDLKKVGEVLGIIGGTITVLGVVGGVVTYVVYNFTKHEDAIKYLNDSINDIKEESSEVKKKNNEINDRIDDILERINDDHKILLELAAISKQTEAYNVVLKDVYQIKTVEVGRDEYLVEPSWEKGDMIASDSKGEIIYTAEDLCNTPIITSYMDGANEVYFSGQFDDSNNWNGKCILNIYNKNSLVSIFEGIYKNGELHSYERLSVEDGNIWVINDREIQKGYNSGATWKYTKSDDFIKGFTIDNVREKQILTVDKFLNAKNEKLISYYKGNTKEGYYNDETGNAYLIKYFKDGELDGADDRVVIRTLYQGRFVGGQFVDESDNAWYITRDVDTTYMFYEGSFSGGTADHIKVKEEENYIRYDYILNKLENKGFEEYKSDFWVNY